MDLAGLAHRCCCRKRSFGSDYYDFGLPSSHVSETYILISDGNNWLPFVKSRDSSLEDLSNITQGFLLFRKSSREQSSVRASS